MNVVKITSYSITIELSSDACREICSGLKERAAADITRPGLALDILAGFFQACAFAIDLTAEAQVRMPRILASFLAEEGVD